MLGVVGAPAQGVIWWGIVGQAAERLELTPGAPASEARNRRAIRARPWPWAAMRLWPWSAARISIRSRRNCCPACLKVDRAGCGSSVKFLPPRRGYRVGLLDHGFDDRLADGLQGFLGLGRHRFGGVERVLHGLGDGLGHFGRRGRHRLRRLKRDRRAGPSPVTGSIMAPRPPAREPVRWAHRLGRPRRVLARAGAISASTLTASRQRADHHHQVAPAMAAPPNTSHSGRGRAGHQLGPSGSILGISGRNDRVMAELQQPFCCSAA